MLGDNILESLCDDLAPFADLGTASPIFTNVDGSSEIRITRFGDEMTINILQGDKIIAEIAGEQRKFASFKSLLASELFANLRVWAKNQEMSLSSSVVPNLIEMHGLTEGGKRGDPLGLIEEFLAEANREQEMSVIFFDGPAGIGKTTLLQNFAFQRAASYTKLRKPLVLHLQSKGKMLQNIFDLIAMNLQVIRSSVTFDQVPVLVKYGLVTMVIDGFDELGDPNGYELAWAQLNDFIRNVKGDASIILSGRETFVSKETMLKALPVVSFRDRVLSLTVLPTEPNIARRWLRQRGWTDEALQTEQIDELLEDGSYALRPFFLKLLAKPELAARVISGEADDLLSVLMVQLLKREAQKFGEDVDRLVDIEAREHFVSDLMLEVARDLAENQTDNIAVRNITWLSDVASVDLPEEVRGILRNRANVIAFLTEDLQQNRVRFFHESVFNYWLSRATIASLSDGEIPKYVRRNILSSDFLDIWNTVCHEERANELEKIFEFSVHSAGQFGSQDRTKRNFMALACAITSIVDAPKGTSFRDITIEEMIFRETSSEILLKNIFVSQLDIRGADISKVTFEDCQIHSALVDKATQIGESFPIPTILVNEEGEETDRDTIRNWHFEQTAPDFDFSKILERAVSQVPELVLLKKIARFRRYWIKDDETDPVARKILSDPSWPALSEALLNLKFMVSSNSVGASGRPSTFYHLRNKETFLNTSVPSKELTALLHEMIRLKASG